VECVGIEIIEGAVAGQADEGEGENTDLLAPVVAPAEVACSSDGAFDVVGV